MKPLYARSVVSSFGSGTVSPFLGVYALKLGATPAQMGWFSSVSNLAPNFVQVPWGKLSDKIGKRVPFILLGGIITSVLFIPLFFITSATQLIVVVGVQALLGSMATPAWMALLGELVHSQKRGIEISAINRAAAIGSLLATLIAGYLMVMITGTLHEMFFAPLLIAISCGLVSSFVMLVVREKPYPNKSSSSGSNSLIGIREVVQEARKNPSFTRFCVASVIFGFFMSISWPLFSITQIKVVNASMLEVALISVIMGAVRIPLQPWGGKLVDRVGRRQLIVVFRLSLVLVPVIYALASNIYFLYAYAFLFGVLVTFGEVAMFTYLLDVTDERFRGALSAFYNSITGIAFFAGSLVGGYLANYFVEIFGLVFGLQLVYALSATGRAAGALTFTTIRDPYKYPSTLKKELRNMVHRLPWMPERSPTQP